MSDFKVGQVVTPVARLRKQGWIDIQRKIIEVHPENYYLWGYADMGEYTAIGAKNEFYGQMYAYDWEVKND